ncbi:hypothetical protein HMPREF9347_06068, partial [Escherichia coli MS 124-1]
YKAFQLQLPGEHHQSLMLQFHHRPGFDNWRQPVGQTVNAVSGLPAGRAKRVNPPLTAIFKEEPVRKYGLFFRILHTPGAPAHVC